MTFALLAIRNLSRNRLRLTLTVLGVATAIVAFLLLRTVTWTWAGGSRAAPTDRIVTRHKITLSIPLPRRYVDDVRGVAHVRATIAMGARERSGEYGVLRAIGFRPGHVARWIVVESFATGMLGGLAGALLAWPFINVLVRRLIDDNVGAFFPRFGLDAGQAALGVGLSGALGAAAGALPAWRAAKASAVDAVRRV